MAAHILQDAGYLLILIYSLLYMRWACRKNNGWMFFYTSGIAVICALGFVVRSINLFCQLGAYDYEICCQLESLNVLREITWLLVAIWIAIGYIIHTKEEFANNARGDTD